MQCAMMINNNVAVHTGHVTTHENVIADKISRIRKETNSMRHFQSLIQDYPELSGCRRFHPSKESISHIMDAILQKKLLDPVKVSSRVLKNPGQTTI